MDGNRPANLTVTQIVVTFIPAGVLLLWALLAPELTRELDVNRTRLTIWAATLLLIPAFLLYPFRAASSIVANLAHLLWTFAYLVFMVHAAWAVFILYGGIANTFVEQGDFQAGINFTLIGVWTIDVLLLWAVSAPGRALVIARLAVRTFAFLVFVITLLFLRQDAIRVLGIVMAAGVSLVLLLRAIATMWAQNPSQQLVK